MLVPPSRVVRRAPRAPAIPARRHDEALRPGLDDRLARPVVARPSGRGSSRPLALARLLGPLVLVAAWFVVGSLDLGGGILPSPGQICYVLGDFIAAGPLRAQVLQAVGVAVLGMAGGVAAGVLLAIWTSVGRWGEYLVDPSLRLVGAVPVLGLIPVALATARGPGQAVLVGLGALIPVYLRTRSAIAGVDPRFVDLARTLGLSRAEVRRRVIVPGCLPGFLVGLRWSAATAWFVLGLNEALSSDLGAGVAGADSPPGVTAAIAMLLVLGMLGALSDSLIRYVERGSLAWQLR